MKHITISGNHGTIKHISIDQAEKMYLDYLNNFLTLSKFAEHYGISYVSAQRIRNTFNNK